MSKPTKSSTPTNSHAVAGNSAQRTKNVTTVPIRVDSARLNRPSSRGTPSRASNNSRGARASEDRNGRSFDDADDHIHWLNSSVPAIEGDAQSFQSLTLDSSQRREMANLIERQRSNARMARDTMPIQPSHEHHPQLFLERNITTSTEGLSDITSFESDDGHGSDRTTIAFYMGSPNRDNSTARMVQSMTDDEITALEHYLRYEKQRRIQQVGDLQAIEARKQVRRSKSGGSEAAFTRKYSNSPGNHGLERKISGDLNTSMNSLRLGSYEGQEPEDPEVRSLFLSNDAPTPNGTYPQPSPYAIRVNSCSRGSGAVHPTEKMFEPPKNGTTPSPATTNAANSSLANSVVHFMNSPNQLHSPVQAESYSSLPGSRSASRPGSRGLASMLNTHSSDLHQAATTKSGHSTTMNNNYVSGNPSTAIAAVVAAFSSIEREEESNGRKLSHRISTNREFVFSPSCAFDDISLGSQKSINSSRSSRTRVLGETVEWSSPSSTFSKHHNVPVTASTNLKKTVYTTEIAKKSKKNQ